MKLNATHIEILTDRPEECIVECLEGGWSQDKITEAIASVLEKIKSGQVNYDSMTEVEQDVISNMVYCSTTACRFVENARHSKRRDRVSPEYFEEYNRICIAGQQLAKHCKTEFPET